jgi:hypothetical protein
VTAETRHPTGGPPAAAKVEHAKTEPAEAAPARPDAPPLPHLADRVKAEAMRASMSAIMTADVTELHTSGTLLGLATVGNDADITASAAAVVSAGGDVSIHQAVVWGVVSKGDVTVDQGASALTVARDYEVRSGVAGLVVATEATVSHGLVGFLLAPKATLSDDSRVIIGTIPALIIGGAIVVGFGLLAVAAVGAVRSALAWRPKLPGLRWE